MDPKHKRLAAKLLELASEQFANNGCNNFDLVKEGGMSTKEAYEFVRAYHSWNGDPEEATKTTNLADFACMAFLASELETEGKP